MANLSRRTKEIARQEIQFALAALRFSKNCPEGVYVSSDPEDYHTWNAVIFLRGGPYAGGVFRFDVVFPADFPGAAPSVYFPPTLLHPLVDATSGRLSLAPRFPGPWRPCTDMVSHLLFYVAQIFTAEHLSTLREGLASNVEVWRMYHENGPLFAKLATQSATLSTAPSSLYDATGGSGAPGRPPDESFEGRERAHTRNDAAAPGISFSELSPDELQDVRRHLFGRTPAEGVSVESQ